MGTASVDQAAAEQVRDWLVGLRGGAPFLSGADARLLGQWLAEGVPVPLILTAVEQTAQRRARSGAKRRLTLVSCRRSVDKARKTRAQGGAIDPGTVHAAQPAEAWRSAVQGWAETVPHTTEGAVLAQRLMAVAHGPAQTREEAAAAALSAVAAFHEARWQGRDSGRDQAMAQAQAELSALGGGLPAPLLRELTEERARALLRAQVPQVSAQALWDRLDGLPT